jgi:hypothetical protein
MPNLIESTDTAAIAALMESAAAAPVADAAPSEAFLLRAAAAAQRAAELRRMAAAARETGFKPLPLPDYLAAIAFATKTSLSRVLPNLSGHLLDPWVQLGQNIALPAGRLRLLVRAFFAAREAPAPMSIFARGSFAGGSAPAIPDGVSEPEFETRLARIESAYSEETRRRLDETLDGLNL